jgi:RNA polymerase sigma factor (sigma-70 family)
VLSQTVRLRRRRVAGGRFDEFAIDRLVDEQQDDDDWHTWSRPVVGEGELLVKFAGVRQFVARRYARSRLARDLAMDWDDLLQVAWIGVLRAIRTHRPDAGANILTWVVNNARFSVQRALSYANARMRRIYRVSRSIDAASNPLDGEGGTLLDTIAAREPKPDEVTPFVVRALAHLREHGHHREAEILEARLLDGRTLQEIGDQLGVSRERVRQIEAKAIKRFENDKWTKRLDEVFS